MIDTSTEAGRAERIKEIINEHASKSKHRGDAHYRLAQSWGEGGDYVEGLDDGSHPSERFEN